MKKLAALFVAGLVFAACGCGPKYANCKPCKFNADQDKVQKEMKQIEAQPAKR